MGPALKTPDSISSKECLILISLLAFVPEFATHHSYLLAEQPV
jgi:hypothetical protein